jgi:hypothetical protein
MLVANLQILHLCFHLEQQESQLQRQTTPLVKEKMEGGKRFTAIESALARREWPLTADFDRGLFSTSRNTKLQVASETRLKITRSKARCSQH